MRQRRSTPFLCAAAMVLAGGLLAGCPWGPLVLFGMDITPVEVTNALPGQRCVFLVDIERLAYFAGPVEVSVHVDPAKAHAYVENAQVAPGELAEVSVIPKPLEAEGKQEYGRDVQAVIRAEYDGQVSWRTVNIHITSEEEDTVGEQAADFLEHFVAHIEANEPQLGITEHTEWEGTIVSPQILIVTHYLFFSDDWEAHVFWHVMIPPHDWARIELRHRFDESLPTLAFEISSVDAVPPYAPISIEPSDTLWR